MKVTDSRYWKRFILNHTYEGDKLNKYSVVDRESNKELAVVTTEDRGTTIRFKTPPPESRYISHTDPVEMDTLAEILHAMIEIERLHKK